MNILKTVNDYLTKIYLDLPSVSWVPRMTEKHLLNDSFYGIPPKTPQLAAIQPKPTPEFWRPAETPGSMSALENISKLSTVPRKLARTKKMLTGSKK